jgi:endonuclease/exonuclease/phosphatase family metal-dependent hydrolase
MCSRSFWIRWCWMVVFVGAAVPPGAAADPAPTARTLRVLCYNIHHGRGMDNQVDLPRIAGVIRAAQPDLVALQEVDQRTARTNRVAQTDELAQLTGLHGHFCKQIPYEGGEYGQAVLSKWPIGKVTIHWLPGEPDREQRIAAAAEIEMDGRALVFATTHLHHNNAMFRQQQAAVLNEKLGSLPTPVIVAGDLNATPDSPPLELLRSVWSNATEGDQPRLSFPADRPERQLDYVLFRPSSAMRVVSHEVIDEAVASDHRPVLVVLEWSPDGTMD